MKLLVDMNLSPRWVEALRSAGIEARHWSTVGDGRASDTEIFAWARRHDGVRRRRLVGLHQPRPPPRADVDVEALLRHHILLPCQIPSHIF